MSTNSAGISALCSTPTTDGPRFDPRLTTRQKLVVSLENLAHRVWFLRCASPSLRLLLSVQRDTVSQASSFPHNF